MSTQNTSSKGRASRSPLIDRRKVHDDAVLIERLFRERYLATCSEDHLRSIFGAIPEPKVINDPLTAIDQEFGLPADDIFGSDFKPLIPRIGYWNYSRRDQELPHVAFGLFGTLPAPVQDIVAHVAMSQVSTRPLFLCDRPESRAFTDFGYTFEFWSDSANTIAKNQEFWLKTKFRKWNITSFQWFGPDHLKEFISQ